ARSQALGRSVRTRDSRIELTAEDDRGSRVPIEIRPVAPDIVRLHFGAGASRPSRLLVDDAPSATEWQTDDRGDGWSCSTPALTIELDCAPFRVAVSDTGGGVRF